MEVYTFMDKNTPCLISVIVPIYNTQHFLPTCIDSILNQTYQNLEIILINDGSTDTSPILCNQYANYDSRITIIHKENGGVSSARNAGLKIATGEYIAFVDSDDYLDPDFFANLSKYDADVIVSGQDKATGLQNISTIKQNYYDWDSFVGPCEKLYKRSMIQGIHFKENLPIGEDIIFNLEVLNQIQNAYFITYSGYHIVNNPASLTREKLGTYNMRLDEEYQSFWGNIHVNALKNAGIPEQKKTLHNINSCSIWIFQKIQNYCYSDCPHPYKERIKRIRRQLDSSKKLIPYVTQPISPKTYAIIKLCTICDSAHFTYALFKILTFLKK